MPIYRIFINRKDTGKSVIASSRADAYTDIAASKALTYCDDVQLKKISDEDVPVVGFNAIGQSPAEDQQLSE